MFNISEILEVLIDHTLYIFYLGRWPDFSCENDNQRNFNPSCHYDEDALIRIRIKFFSNLTSKKKHSLDPNLDVSY